MSGKNVLVGVTSSLLLWAMADVAGAVSCEFPQRVAVFQAGTYVEFQNIFRQTSLHLLGHGYINPQVNIDINFKHDEPKAFAQISEQSRGGCIEFVEDGFYDGKWDPALIDQKEQELRQRIATKNDIDMIWALGTIAGLRFADSSLKKNVLVMAAITPSASGIVGDSEYSDKPYVFVLREKDRHYEELNMFHDIFKFKRLGVILDPHPEFREGQAYTIVQQVVKEKGLTLVECYGDLFSDPEQAKKEFARCCLELSQNSDAVYINSSLGIDERNMYYQIKPLIDAKIPTFSQYGSEEVEQGVLLSLAETELNGAGRFMAHVIAKILQGTKPEEISQFYFLPLLLALNLQTAKMIEWKPDFSVLIALDRVFQNIKIGKIEEAEETEGTGEIVVVAGQQELGQPQLPR